MSIRDMRIDLEMMRAEYEKQQRAERAEEARAARKQEQAATRRKIKQMLAARTARAKRKRTLAAISIKTSVGTLTLSAAEQLSRELDRGIRAALREAGITQHKRKKRAAPEYAHVEVVVRDPLADAIRAQVEAEQRSHFDGRCGDPSGKADYYR